MNLAHRAPEIAIESAGKLWAPQLLGKLLNGTLAEVNGRTFQFKDGDYQVVDFETGCTRSLELKCRGAGKWFAKEPILFERWHDKNKVDGRAMKIKSQLLAYAWEDIKGVLVLNAPAALSWYREQLYRITRRERKPFYRNEPAANSRQMNRTVFDCAPISDVQPFIVAEDFGLAKSIVEVQKQPQQPLLF